LVTAGWGVDALPGQPVTLRMAGAELRPFAVMLGLLTGEKQPADWDALHVAGGISDIPLVDRASRSRRSAAAIVASSVPAFKET